MLTKSLRKSVEWQFYNYRAEVKKYEQKRNDIIESGLTATYGRTGSSYQHGNPTENKAIRLEELNPIHDWVTVVRNTVNAFRFSFEYELMKALYEDGRYPEELIKTDKNPKGIVSGSTFYYMRDNWLNLALRWAKEFKLL